MLERTRTALVNSFVGAIALGFVFAQAIAHFTGIFTAPIANWIMRQEYHGLMDRSSVSTAFSLDAALPELAKSVALLVVGYVLLRWLYFEPLRGEIVDQPPEPLL